MSENRTGILDRAGLLAGLAAAIAMLATMLFLRAVLSIPSLPEMLSEALTLIIPVSVFSRLLGALEEGAKPLLLAGLLLGHLVMGAIIGIVYARAQGQPSDRRGAGWMSGPWAGSLVISAALWLVSLLIVMPAAGAGLLGMASRAGPVALILSSLVASTAFGLSLAVFFRGLVATRETTSDAMTPEERQRRLLLMRLVSVPIGLMIAGGLYQLLGRQGADSISEMEGAAKARRSGTLPEEITPTPQFYTVSKNFKDPVVDLKEWSMDLRAPGGKRLTLSYNDLKSLPAVEQVATLTCISNEIGGDLISNARWTGVRLRDLLERLGGSEAVDVVLKAWDGYADSIPFDKAIQEGTILAYMMNGEPLAPVHGFPARLVVPGIYGMKNVKWVTAIELVDYDFKGYWQNRGWSDVATIKTMSRLDVPAKGSTLSPAPVDLGGIAFAGDRGISKVEVSADAGRTWFQMDLKPALSPYAWSLWTGRWQPSESGDYVLLARAWDGSGQLQERAETEPLPDGASGYDGLPLTLR